MELRTAKDHIDRLFGEGTSDSRPELVIEYLKVDALKDIKMLMKNIFEMINTRLPPE